MSEPGPEPHEPGPSARPVPRLGLWDAISLITGIVVGTSIFRAPMTVSQNVAGPWQMLGVWLLGGLLSFCGALCYAELAATYPRDGGAYEYLRRAYGGGMGFLFGWAQLSVIASGNIGIMAFVFADYALRLFDAGPDLQTTLAIGAVAILTAVNTLGLVVGKSVQNLLTLAKVLGLATVALAGLLARSDSVPTPAPGVIGPGFGLALVFVLYAYGGWNDAAFVAAEVRDPTRNLPRALLGGMAGVTLIYLIVNASYLALLGFDGVRQSPTPAADALDHAFGPWGGRFLSVIVMTSALGAINGMVLTSARVYATLGADYHALRWLSAWRRGAGTGAPLAALIAQLVVTTLMVLAVGTAAGRNAIDRVPQAFGFEGLPWSTFGGGFDTLVVGSSPVFWAFFLLTALAVPVLRWRDGSRPRPFRVPIYPLPLIAFCATSAFMLYSSAAFARWLMLLGIVPLAFALPIAALNRKAPPRAESPPAP